MYVFRNLLFGGVRVNFVIYIIILFSGSLNIFGCLMLWKLGKIIWFDIDFVFGIFC